MCKSMIAACLIEAGRAAITLFGGVVRFVRQHSILRAPAAFALLAADFFFLHPLSFDEAPLQPFDLVEQKPAGNEAVQPLLASGLALHLHTSGPMMQHDAGGTLVHVLAAVSS